MNKFQIYDISQLLQLRRLLYMPKIANALKKEPVTWLFLAFTYKMARQIYLPT